MANELPSDPSFHFPYTPYDIQLDLMQHVYSSLAKGQVTVIESPTGTGKSLSLISSTLSWLSDSKARAREDFIRTVREGIKKESGDDDPDWVIEADVKRKVDEFDLEERELEVRLELIREKEKKAKASGKIVNRLLNNSIYDESSLEGSSKRRKIDPDEEFAPDPYEDDDSEEALHANDNYSSAVRELMQRSAPKTIQYEIEEPDVRKIYFASRTHSQLAQFVGEIRKTAFAETLAPPLESLTVQASSGNVTSSPSHPVRVIPLGSRENLCINDAVKKKCGGNNEAIGDACLELQKAAKEKRCPHLPPMSEPERLNTFRDQALASIRTITDIEELGRKLGTCPYYGSRKAVRSAEVVTLPYNMLMQKSAREALGISLKDQIVVIDEAHNLIDTVLSLHSISISRSSVSTVKKAIKVYATKFKSRLTGANLIYLSQLVKVLEGIGKFLDIFAQGEERESMKKVGEVLSSEQGGSLDMINLLKLDEYLRTSRIARKIGSYVDKLAEEQTAEGRQSIRLNATKSLQQIQTFIVSLVNATSDGRVLLSKENKNGVSDVNLKYLLLAPSEAFKDLVDEARSVVLAGGTMKPISDFRTQLFPYLPTDRYSTFSCGHVVPQENIKTFAISVGPAPKSMKLDFKSASRTDAMIDELAFSITKISFVVPKGIVIFLPSYAFLKQVQERCGASLVTRLSSAKKTIFWEPIEKTAVEPVLTEYKKIIMESSGGAILFAVVNAKLSEGINFEDDMARAVIICGIPYPNKFSTELSARMTYLNALPKVAGIEKKGGDILYDNLAFRGVNQSIGRAFRHANDWAAIILLDERYSQKSIQAQLPDWLGSNVECPAQFGSFVASLSNFCRTRKKAMLEV